MLILGARYGSIEPRSGLSYIELEYEHAQEHGKPHFSLVLSEKATDTLAASYGKGASELALPEKYGAFRTRVLTKISRLVDDEKDVKLYTMEAIRAVEQKYSLRGWIRGDEAIKCTTL